MSLEFLTASDSLGSVPYVVFPIIVDLGTDGLTCDFFKSCSIFLLPGNKYQPLNQKEDTLEN